MIAVEFAKQVRRVRTWVVAAICIIIPFLVGLGFELGGNNNANGGNGLNFVTHQSGIVIGIFALSFSSVLLIPIVFAIFTGEPIASEARWGSLRYLLVRPVTRPRVLGSKLGVSIVLAVGTTVLIPITGTIVGIAFFGLHPVHTFVIGSGSSVVSGASVATLPIGSALGRLLLATAYTLFSMLSVVGVATLVGVATENAHRALHSLGDPRRPARAQPHTPAPAGALPRGLDEPVRARWLARGHAARCHLCWDLGRRAPFPCLPHLPTQGHLVLRGHRPPRAPAP